MKLRDALIHQAPSLALQRAAADEIARLDAYVKETLRVIKEYDAQLYAAQSLVDALRRERATLSPDV